MHLLNSEIAKDRLHHAPTDKASSVPLILADAAPSMDHLDALEAQSIYILREAFARLKKLAQDVDALRFQCVEVIHRRRCIGQNRRHGRCLIVLCRTQPVFDGVFVEKMHLPTLGLRR